MVARSGSYDAWWAYYSCSCLLLNFAVCASFFVLRDPFLSTLIWYSLVAAASFPCFLRWALSSSMQLSWSNMFLAGTHIPGVLQYSCKSCLFPFVLSSTALSWACAALTAMLLLALASEQILQFVWYYLSIFVISRILTQFLDPKFKSIESCHLKPENFTLKKTRNSEGFVQGRSLLCTSSYVTWW